ncbi:hypothetical protein SAMN05216303_102349 [Rhodoferax sp. OV413]|uniref:hypothetical protein n=1 Tax=Rhodoferax sp. OV413 TaxID=1855285 RepID=UPI00087EC98D|nr:hypothetical protein [Rhodoferax sp. OV413]SDO78532.1 hypothetical protein SAMN05216303_102349 [Rhodoferax sp. OV413]
MNLTCPSCHKVCRPRAKFCNHCLQSFADLTLCRICNRLTPDGQACTHGGATTRANVVAANSHPTETPAAAKPRRSLAMLGLVLAVVLLGGGYALLGQRSTAVAIATPPSPPAVAAPAAMPARLEQAQAEALKALAEPISIPAPLPDSKPLPVVAKRVPAKAPASSPVVPVATVAAPAVPAPEPAAVEKPAAPKAKTIDEVFNERLAAECSSGLSGLVCREKLRYAVCGDRWSQTPPPGQSICKGAPTR